MSHIEAMKVEGPLHVVCQCDKCKAEQEPVAFDDWPEYHEQGMGCGLEDRGITDRYEAMRYGWNEALERAWEAVNLLGPLYTQPQPKREWVGLTAEEVVKCWNLNGEQFWRNIEAKLKEKNT